MNYRYISTPIGELLLAGKDKGLVYIGFPNGKGKVKPEGDWIEKSDCFPEASKQLHEYFRGERRMFNLKLAPHGTPFQLEVLDALLKVPYGQTCTYGDIASSIGRAKAVRAVGAANGRNPLPIVIPCHRVIGASGSLTGFGGGLDVKKFLLNLESPAQGNLGLR
ncbi:MAG: methylated-DNA--[protein]-cysteine S-methyltransferase [Pseudomonadales bacterium]